MPLSFDLHDEYDENHIPVDWHRYCWLRINRYHEPPVQNPVFQVVYAGGLTSLRMFPELVHILGGIDGVEFVVAGHDDGTVADAAEQYESVRFLGMVPLDMVKELTLASHCVICMFDPSGLNNRVGLPNKIFECMVCGRPIVVTKDMYYSDFVERYGCGLCVEYSAEGVTEAVCRLRDDPVLCRQLSINGLMATEDDLNWMEEKKKLVRLYENL